MELQSLLIALQRICASIQDVAQNPGLFVLHRSKCRGLAMSYVLAAQHVARTVRKALIFHANSVAIQNLCPGLSELHHAMLQGEQFLRDCLLREGWVHRALLLASSTEAFDVHLHNLILYLCAIDRAVEPVSIDNHHHHHHHHQQQQQLHVYVNFFDSLAPMWAEAYHESDDLDILLNALHGKVNSYEGFHTIPDGDYHLGKFLVRKLSSRDSMSGDLLPSWLWVSPLEFSLRECEYVMHQTVSHKIEWWGANLEERDFYDVLDFTAFNETATIQAKVEHPNLQRLICCTATLATKKWGLVMELMEHDLRSMIKRRLKLDANMPPFSLSTAVDVMLQISKGMEYLHGLQIVHHDLNASNVLVTPQTIPSSGSVEALLVKIADVGMSGVRCIKESDKGGVRGADVYSFAMLCYEILTGNVPDSVSSYNIPQTLAKTPTLPSSCPQYLASFIEQCWTREPEKRPMFADISCHLRHMKGVLLSSANPSSSLAIMSHRWTFIDEEMLARRLSCHPSNQDFLPACFSILSQWLCFRHMELEGDFQGSSQLQAMSQLSEPPFMSGHWSRRIKSALAWALRRPLPRPMLYTPPNRHPSDRYSNGAASVEALKCFTYKELYAATHCFNRADKIGKGSSGRVFKGKLGDGRMVAVKVMEGSSEKRYKDGFLTELASLGKLRHCNLVPLLGWCWEKGILMLVYEYISRGDLHGLLFGHVQKLFLSLEQRYKIVYGLASALHYLHFQCARPILHRDVNPNNILLDNDYNARLGDFGLAIDLEHTDAQVATCAKGTVGYIAPEYVLTHKLGPEADVYSFGVVVLELACGKRLFKTSSGEVTNAVPFVWNLYTQNRLLDAGDERLSLKTDIKKEDIERLLLLGLACTQCNIEDRPNMELVLRILSKEIQPPTPAHAPYGT